MKQSFSKKQHETFKKYLNINDDPSKWGNIYIEKTEKYIKYIKWIPGIQMIGIGNSISMGCSKESSDIDLYIVTSKNSLWIVRILITLTFQLLGVRKTARKHEGRFCLSFFSTKKGMDFSHFAIKNDIYLYFWIIYFKPLLSYNNTYEEFIKTNSSWADFSGYQNIIEENKTSIKYNKPLPIPPLIRRGGIKCITYINNILKNIFLPKTLNTYEKLKKPFGVIINDNTLKFHNNDIREKVSEQIGL